ncbi:MAG: hypothetical protein RLZZ350_2379 [Verrucomicrobiota bacterium]
MFAGLGIFLKLMGKKRNTPVGPPKMHGSMRAIMGGYTPINGQAGHGFYKSDTRSKRRATRTKPLFDARGNRLSDPMTASKVAIERVMDAMTREERAVISPLQKWDAVELHQQGKIAEALAKLR